MSKKYKNSVSLEEISSRILDSEDSIKEFLNVALESYLKDGDFNAFYRELELAINARGNISEFCKKININRSNLYDIFKKKRNPRLDTVAKILNELGLQLKVA
jgi:probable addiction module antidote protein